MRRRLGSIVMVALIMSAAAGVAAADIDQLHHRLHRIHRQLRRDHGTVRFMVNHPWSRRRPPFMRVEKRAERRIVLERAELRKVLEAIAAELDRAFIAPWLPTVACENGGRWSDSPGSFYLGLQFDPATWATAARHTGVYGTTPHDQVVNAIWTAREALREHAPDPWPNCPDPYFG